MNTGVYILDFAVFEDALLSGDKRQTIRKYGPQKLKSLQNATELNCYWKRGTPYEYHMFNSEITHLEILRFKYPNVITAIPHLSSVDGNIGYELSPRLQEEFARRDGFGCYADLLQYFKDKYGKKLFNQKFIVIHFNTEM